MEERIQKILSNQGICSRREGEEIIKKGLIKVNGKIAKIGDKADIDKDKITYKNKIIKKIKKIYLAINKPNGLVTSTKDPHEKTIMEIIPKKYKTNKIYPIGRLDKYTEGLLIFTNDGNFANELIHPSKKINKTYEGICQGNLTKEHIDLFKQGIKFKEGLAQGRLFFKNDKDKSYFTIRIKTGWNRQIRRMFEKIKHKIIKLKRIEIGRYHIKNLGKKRIKELSKKEIELLLKK